MAEDQNVKVRRPEVKSQVIAADNGTYETEQKNTSCCPSIAPTMEA